MKAMTLLPSEEKTYLNLHTRATPAQKRTFPNICAKCNTPFEGYPTQKFCDNCGVGSRSRRMCCPVQKALYKKVCRDCGAVFISTKARRYCLGCVKKDHSITPRRKKITARLTKEKNCKTCGKAFMGHHNAKYCAEHVSNNHRSRNNDLNKKKEFFGDNLCFEETFMFQEVELHCQAHGCAKKYRIMPEPAVKVYPKYCEEHRNEHRRNMFVAKRNKK